MLVKELVVKLENKVGQLNRVVSVLAGENVNIKAVTCIKVSEEETRVKLIVMNQEKAKNILNREKIDYMENEVIIVDAEDKEGELSKVLDILQKENINIEYVYTTFSYIKKRVLIVFDFDDPVKAMDVLKKNHVSLVTHQSGNEVLNSEEHDIKEYLATVITP